MSEDQLPGIAQSIIDEIHAFAFGAALARLDDPKEGGALPVATAALLRSRALTGLERWHAAYGVLGDVRAMKDLGLNDRLEAQVRTARVLRFASPLVDYALDLALAAAQQATRAKVSELAVEAHIEAALLFGRKRCPLLAAKELDAAAKLGVVASRVWSARGDVALTFDDRPAAKEAFERSLALAPAEPDAVEQVHAARVARLGLARLYTVLGEFDTAASVLSALGTRPPGDVGVRRAAWRLFAAKADWPRAAQALAEIASAVPDGDATRGLMLEHAAALYRAGDLDGARAAWVKIAGSGDGDWASRAAGRTASKLENPKAKRHRLVAFPSVTQLRNHCGPASVELCMRFFGTSAEQVAVAREIKHPDGGTPVHKMRGYMEAAGFHARRIEADLDRLRAILDAGVPVIIEEDYSTTRHVAVAIGYDDLREVLEVQDPMTHEIRETPYEELEKLRAFSNHGALVAVPAADAALVAKLDAAGATECAYMTTTDRAWAAHDLDQHEEAERLVAEAIAMTEAGAEGKGPEPYELAWVLRFVRARDAYDRDATEENKGALFGVLQTILRQWPDDEWPQQFLGRYYEIEGRYADALAAFERARDRDPDDANNWSSIGDCHIELGNRDAARKAFEEALRRDPGHVRANENLANAVFENGDLSLASLLNACALELAPNNPYNSYVRGKILARKDELPPAIEAYSRALELRPGSTGYTVERARLYTKTGQVDLAMSSLSALRDANPKDLYVLVNLADLAYESDRLDTCLAACDALREVDPQTPTPHAIAGAAKCKKGDLEGGLADLRIALSRRPTYAWAHREISRAFATAGRWHEAIAASASAAGISKTAENDFRLGDTLARAGFPNEGLGYLKSAAESANLHGAQLDRVAEVLRDVEGVGSAHRFFGALVAQNERDVEIARAHARLLLERAWAPGAAVKVLSHLSELDPEHPLVLANQADDMMDESMDREGEGEELFRKAIAMADAQVAPRRFFARQLIARGRNVEALAILAPLPADAETLEDRVHALLGERRDDEARAAVEAWCASLPADQRDASQRPLAYEIAKANRRFDEALALAIEIAKDEGELDDDGELGRWERARFECLVELGRSDEAFEFGIKQCADAEDRGRLAYSALGADDWQLAKRLGEASYELDEDEPYALAVLARVADYEGDVDRAVQLYSRMREVSRWHVHVENLGRLAMAAGKLDEAEALVEQSVATGHCCPVSLQLRAELRVRKGDREGARADAERANGCLQLEVRDVSEDLDGLRAGLAGRRDEARSHYERFFARAKLSASDRRRHEAVLDALLQLPS